MKYFLFSLSYLIASGICAQDLWITETLRTNIVGAWVRAGDFDNDGDPDILIQAGDSIYWHENLRPGWEPHLVDPAFYNSDAAWVDVLDLDGDGDIDVLKAPVSSTSINTLTWNENISNGSSWDQHFILNTSNNIGSMQKSYGDLDGDGDIDIVVPEYNNNLGSLYWLENDNNSPEYIKHPINAGDHLHSSVADLDGDGDLDIVSAWKDLFWLENQLPENTWTKHGVVGPGSDYYPGGTCSDLNSDGKEDIISNLLFGGNDRVVYYSNPDWEEININTSPGIILGETGDIDSDGDSDVTFGGSGHSGVSQALGWAENQNSGMNWELHNIAPATTLQTYSTGIADIDGDGDMDMVALVFNTNSGNGSVFWAANPMFISNTSDQNLPDFRFSVSPNPVSDYLDLFIENEKQESYRIQLLDLSGKLYRKFEMTSKKLESLQVNDLPAGTYLVNVVHDDDTYFRKFIKL